MGSISACAAAIAALKVCSATRAFSRSRMSNSRSSLSMSIDGSRAARSIIWRKARVANSPPPHAGEGSVVASVGVRVAFMLCRPSPRHFGQPGLEPGAGAGLFGVIDHLVDGVFEGADDIGRGVFEGADDIGRGVFEGADDIGRGVLQE